MALSRRTAFQKYLFLIEAFLYLLETPWASINMKLTGLTIESKQLMKQFKASSEIK